MTRSRHWDEVYGAREEDRLTWFEASPDLSLSLIERHRPPESAVIDVGGGTSRLVDELVRRGIGPVTVLDLSRVALEASRSRLGQQADAVDWQVADITRWQPARSYGVWHDRAVFHFLTETADRAAYVAALDEALETDGVAIIMTFAEDGPETCSGLPIRRYSPDGLVAEIDRHAPGRFDLVERRRHLHRTPMGRSQSFQASVLRRRNA